MKKRILAIALCVAMVLSMVPFSTFADGDTVAAETITLDETSLELVIGNSAATLTPTVGPEEATDKTVTWTSSDEDVATVVDGVVTAVAPGSATITATANGGTDVKATCNVTVAAAAAEWNSIYFDTLASALLNVTGSGDTITLVADNAAIDFKDKEFTLDLGGFALTGTAVNAAGVTIVNNGTKQTTLAAVGTYKNSVSAFVADGFDTKTTTTANDTVFSTTAAGVYTVTVEATTDTDRDATNDSNPTGTTVDVFAGDEVTVTVKVTGARFVAADVTLSYDKDNFKIVEAPSSGWTGDYELEYMEEDQETVTGKARFYNAKSGGGYYADGTVLGTFVFEALPGDEAKTDVPFAITTSDTYVAGAWSEGWSSSAANKLADAQLVDDAANIRLKEMTASVTAESGLSYKGDNTPQKLVKDAFSAKDNTTGATITGATIKYCVLTQDEIDGTPLTDEDGNTLYYTTSEKTATSTTETEWPAYAAGKEPKTPTTYTTTNPAVINADDYVLYYQISKPGYVTVSDSVAVSIAKASVTLNWTAAQLTAVTAGMLDGAGNEVTTDYFKKYSGATFANPVATYTSLTTNASANATVALTAASNGSADLTLVGDYTFTATINDNYSITNPTCTVLIDGGAIEGYTLGNTDEGTEEWYDAANHAVAKLTTASDATADTTIKYSLDGGTTWQDEIPNVKEVGKYTLTMKLTAAGYYDQTQTVNFEIKNVEYKVEKTDYVYGWDLVLVYTNDAVPGFKYSGAKMYDISGLVNGYKYANTTAYTHVYGLVIKGDADITLVVPSNVAALTFEYASTTSQYDVNNSGGVDINDLVAAQGTYNVDAKYMNDEQMSIVLRADANRDKMVNTQDCALIKNNKTA